MDTDLSIESFVPRRAALRVTVVTETFPPEVNGVATSLEQLVRALQARDHTLQLVRPRQPSDGYDRDGARLGLEQVLTRGVPIPRYPALRMGLPARRALQSLWSLRRPDLVHIATEGPLGWSALRVARKLRLPVSTDFRTQFHAYSQHYGMGLLAKPIAAYLRRFHNQADCTMVPTAELRQWLLNMGFERVHVVGRGVDTERFSPRHRSEAVRAAWGLQPHERALLYVGRVAPEKNLALLARAADAMRTRDPRWRLVVVGDGPARAELQRQLPWAVCVGWLQAQALGQAYASADLLVFPSLTETFGNVVAEALASGLPVLAFDYAAAATLLQHGRGGCLVPYGDEAAFVQAALALAADADRLAQLRAEVAALRTVPTWADVASQVEQIWVECLAAHRRSGWAAAWSSPWPVLPRAGDGSSS